MFIDARSPDCYPELVCLMLVDVGLSGRQARPLVKQVGAAVKRARAVMIYVTPAQERVSATCHRALIEAFS